MKKLLIPFLLLLAFFTQAQEEDTRKWIFHAGAANGLNFFEESNSDANVHITSYKRVSIGNGLGAELGFKLPKHFSLWGNYYMYVFKNKVNNSFYPFIDQLSLKQITQNVALTAQYDFFHRKGTTLYVATGGGIALENVQYYKETFNNYSLSIGEYNNSRFLMPVKVGTSRIIKDHFILGASVQMFVYGTQHPFRTLNLFSYLGVVF